MVQLRQFVPSSVCLKCEGCCRFQSADSPWRPKFDRKEFTDDQDYITTIADCGDTIANMIRPGCGGSRGRHLCRFFNKAGGTCRIYEDRPFECALYPFLLSQEPDGLKVYVHLACPYVQEHEQDPALRDYIAYLRDFFSQPATGDFLRRNRPYTQNYRPMAEEALYLFTLAPLP